MGIPSPCPQIWSGEIELKNLRLKASAIKKFNLPVEVLHGSVGSLRIRIPWAKLSSESVTAELTDIYMAIQPVDMDLAKADQIRQSVLEAKKAMLEKMTAVAKSNAAAMEQTSKHDSGYFARLAKKIADNIYIYVRNFHVR